MAYAKDLRVRLIRAAGKGQSARSQADVFDVSASTAVKWVQVFRAEGRVEAKPHAGGRRSPLSGHADWLKARVEQQPDIALNELCIALSRRGVDTSKSAVSRFLLRMGFRKKKPSWPANRSARTSLWPGGAGAKARPALIRKG